MKISAVLSVALYACAATPSPAPAQPCPEAATAPVVACFVPDEPCEDRIVALIDGARKSLRVQAYSFTSAPIASAIVRARARKVDVGVILDASESGKKGSQLAALIAAGVPTWIDGAHAIAHSKVVVVDGTIVETGSENYSAAGAHANAENIVVIHSRALAASYEANWEEHRGHSAVASGGASR